MRGVRYCEVLLVDVTDDIATATVFNSYPLNDCPEQDWLALDAAALARENGVTVAVLNGPRYWSIDRAARVTDTEPARRTFGNIDMNQYATVEIGPLASASTPYLPRSVDRRARFSYDAGSTIHELVDDHGARWVMQSWSQQVDPSLDDAALADLGSRLQLPSGWRYETRTLDRELVVDTTDAPARVLQDELRNSYSRLPTS